MARVRLTHRSLRALASFLAAAVLGAVPAAAQIRFTETSEAAGLPGRAFGEGQSIQADSYTLVDIAPAAGVTNPDHGHFGCTWSDYDGDGWLDLYLANTDDNTLYRNNGDHTFTDVTAQTGAGDPFVAMRNVWADYDKDGDLDLYSHNFVRSTLYQNNGNVFSNVNLESGAGVQMPNGTGASWIDYDRDGWLDLHATGFPTGWTSCCTTTATGPSPTCSPHRACRSAPPAWGTPGPTSTTTATRTSVSPP